MMTNGPGSRHNLDQLRRSDQLFRLIMSNVRDFAIFTLDSRGILRDWSVGAQSITGYAGSEMLGRPFTHLFTAADQAAGVPERELKVAEQEGRADDVRWHPRKDGSKVWLVGVTTALYDDSGTLQGFVNVARDATFQHKVAADLELSRRKLQESEANFRLLAEEIPQLVWATNPQGDLDYCNGRWLEYTGLKEAEALGQGWRIAVHPDDLTHGLEAWHEASEAGTHLSIEARIRRKDGAYRWFLCRAVPVEDGDGHIVRWFGTNTDIDEQRRWQDRIAQAKEHEREWLESILDHLPVGLVMVQLGTGNVLYANKTMDTLAEGAYENFLAGVDEHAYATDREGKRIGRADMPRHRTARGEILSGFEMTWNWSGGTRPLLVHSSVLPARFENPPLGLVVFQDIGDRKRMEVDLQKAKEAADAANRAKSAFLANMSHEIRTPLGAVMGFADLLRDPETNETKRREFIDAILRNTKLLAQLIDDILDLSKVEAGKLQMERVTTSLIDLMNDVETIVWPAAMDKGICLRITPDEHTPSFITTDPIRLKQVLINIIGNAVKFTREGGVHVMLTQSQPAPGHPPMLVFTVKDTGRGISPEQRQELFQPFSQADASTTRKYGGTGLGLVLARRLALGLGGNVELTSSEPNVGSVFTVTIDPTPSHGSYIVDNRVEKEASKSKSQSRTELSGVDVLVAEDTPDNRFLLRQILRASGASVDLAENGEEAVRKALGHSYDVVLMDLQMPIRDGFEATKELRSRGYDRPILAVSAAAMQDERDRALAVGCDDHLTKPITKEQLVNKVRAYAAQHAH